MTRRPKMFAASIAALFAAVMMLGPSTLQASEGWTFRRSYYSHADSPGFTGGDVYRPRGAYRDAYTTHGPRFVIRGGLRFNSINLSIGNNNDRTIIRENYFDIGPTY
jgi:hypothetical protein